MMLRGEILKKLNSVFEDVFDDEFAISETTLRDDINEWDSFNHMLLLASIQNEFDIEFSMGEIVDLEDVKHIVDAIEVKLNV